jgi:hypothetical protein
VFHLEIKEIYSNPEFIDSWKGYVLPSHWLEN